MNIMKKPGEIKFIQQVRLIVLLFLGILIIPNNISYGNTHAGIDSAIVEEVHFPIIIGQSKNPVLLIKIYNNQIDQSNLTQIYLTIEDSITLQDVVSLEVFFTADNEVFSSEKAFGTLLNVRNTNVITGIQPLEEGANYFWVTVTLSTKTDLLDKIILDCNKITDSGNNTFKPLPHVIVGNRPAIGFRGDSAVYNHRIYLKNPGLVTTNKGTQVTVFDMRHYKPKDAQSDIDIGTSRSTDNGKTWEPIGIAMDMGEFGGLPQDQNGLCDPSILLDKSNNTIWVAALWSHAYDQKRFWTHSQPGMTPEETGQLVLVKSEDDGKTWSSPINITEQIKDPSWYLFLQGPGKGITMKDGTLVFSAQFKDSTEMPFSTIIYSRDHGETWHIGTGAKPNTTESQVVELQDGSLMLNLRDNRGGSRSVYITNDMGKSWTKHPTSRSALPEPVCQASIINFHYDTRGLKRNCCFFPILTPR